MSHFRLLAVPAAIAAMSATQALAADYQPSYQPPIYVEEAPEWVPVEIGSGWYLRGDVGYSLRTRPNGAFTYRTFTPGPAPYATELFDTARLSDNFSFGGGVGYHFNDWLRADATLDRITSHFTGTRTDFPVVGGRTEDSATMVGYQALLNGYVDVGTISGFTPYVGAGAGITHVKWNGMTSQQYDAGGVAILPAVNHDAAAASWRFTYALMAGMAYDLGNNIKVDLGYKFSRISGGSMYNWDAPTALAGATGVQGRDPGLSRHDIRVGLRYNLW